MAGDVALAVATVRLAAPTEGASLTIPPAQTAAPIRWSARIAVSAANCIAAEDKWRYGTKKES